MKLWTTVSSHLPTDMISLDEAQTVLQNAELIYSPGQVNHAIDTIASQINRQFMDCNQTVLVLPIMNGGLVLGGKLITRLKFPLQVDYLHATRYRNSTTGCELHWKVEPQQSLENRTLLIIDDIFDEGFTLESVVEYCQQQGAAKIATAVLVEKDHPRDKAKHKCDFVGLQVEDRYVFGCGMDYKSYHRNLDGIYALKEDGDE